MKVLVVAPNDADFVLVAEFLREKGIETLGCASAAELSTHSIEVMGCVLLLEEALDEHDLAGFHEHLLGQPPWSDLPLLVVAEHTSSLTTLVDRAFPESGNVTVLQRPLHPVSLVSAVTVALRARHRQFEVRDLLAERALAVAKRDQFMAMLAHELRNPLAPIRNAVYLMSTLGVKDPLFARTRAMIEKQAKHMTRLVDDLLDASRLERGKLELQLQHVDLGAAVEAAAESCRPLTDSRNHRLELERQPGPLWIRGDPVRIEQVFGNLIVNAAKFTPPGGRITVSIARSGDDATVSVRDTGVGIRPERAHAVFELFSQESNDIARTAGGLGIGLTLVRQLTELHGGSVRLASEGEGLGACFEVRLPLAAAPEAVASAAPDEPRDASPRRVLVVEDSPDIRESLALLMDAWRHDATFAATGWEGVAAATRLEPDVALIDIGLPGIDGYEVARRIRESAQPWARRVVLVALTGYGQAADREEADRAGFDSHLLKPVDPERLRQVLQLPSLRAGTAERVGLS